MGSSLSRFGDWMMGRDRKSPDNEKRYWSRVPAHERVIVFWNDDRGDDVEQPGQVLDISDGGWAVRMDVEVPVGMDVRLRTAGSTRSAVVRHIRPDGHDFVLGLEAS